MTKKRIAVSGGLGRMGQMTLAEISKDTSLELSGVLVRSDNPESVFKTSDVVVDFSSPQASIENAKAAAKTGTALVIGTTGFSNEQLALIKDCAISAPILLSYNMSFAITALGKTVGGLSRALGPGFHLEITDIHHKDKKDAPSGTALLLGAASGRDAKDIKYTSHREGNVIGEHRVLFSGPGEQVELVHRAKDRKLFAQGGLLAAHWLVGKKNGFYSLKDILNEAG